jgi:predicted Holliday junction resolvase-like endonuclease
MRKWIVFGFVLLFPLLGVSSTKGDEISELKQQLAEQQQLLLKMQQKIEQMEAQQKEQSQQIEQKVSEALEKKGTGTLPESIKWVENIKFFGDLRYLNETIVA